ncbi:MAG: hypothetical protein JWO03_1161 [Bacteroidetes bacterium]|nr:hypothetical protein [Bacteroidota bacterium]
MLKLTALLIICLALSGATCLAQAMPSDTLISDRDSLVQVLRSRQMPISFLHSIDTNKYESFTYGPSYGPVTITYDRQGNVRSINSSRIANVITGAIDFYYDKDTMIYAYASVMEGRLITVEYFLSGGEYIYKFSPEGAGIMSYFNFDAGDSLLKEAKAIIAARK